MENLQQSKKYINFRIENYIILNRIYTVCMEYFMENKDKIRKYNTDYTGDKKDTMYINLNKRHVDKLNLLLIDIGIDIHYFILKKDYSVRFEFSYKIDGYYNYNETQNSIYINKDYEKMIESLQTRKQHNTEHIQSLTIERSKLETLYNEYTELQTKLKALMEPLNHTIQSIISWESDTSRRISEYNKFLSNNQ